MDYSKTSIAIAFSDWKGAALYFDDVILVSGPDEEIRSDPTLEREVINATNVFYPKLRWSHRVGPDFGFHARDHEGEPFLDPILHPKQYKLVVQTFVPFARTGSARSPTASLWGSPLLSGLNEGADAAVVLGNLQLVDPSRISWRQILEMRKDEAAMKQLRKLRRTVLKDYGGKPEAYIRDDIETRVEEYRLATKVWALPLGTGVLEIAMTGEVLTTFGAAVSLACFGAPISAVAAAGGCIAIGKTALAFAKRKREIELEALCNPMAYVVRLQDSSYA